MGASDRTHASENMHSGHYVASHELRYFLAREIRERFRLIDKLTFLLFDTSLNHGVGGRGSLKNFLQAFSLSSRYSVKQILLVTTKNNHHLLVHFMTHT